MATRFVSGTEKSKTVDVRTSLVFSDDGSSVDLKVTMPDRSEWYICRLEEGGLVLYSGLKGEEVGVALSGDYVKVSKD